MKTLTQKRLKELLHYDSETGIFTWLQRAAHRIQIGDVAGSPEGEYWRIRLDNQLHRAHRLAWLYCYGEWPKGEIDHKDWNKRNNSIKNLRDVSHRVNDENIRTDSRFNSTGYLGVSRTVTAGRFKAEISSYGKKTHLGCFSTPKLAHQAYIEAKRKMHEGCML